MIPKLVLYLNDPNRIMQQAGRNEKTWLTD